MRKLDIYEWMRAQKPSFWYELSQNQDILDSKERSFAYSFAKTLTKGNPTTKQIKFAINIFEKYQKEKTSSDLENKSQFNATAVKNFTARMAWHDSKWNGKICKNPELNEYCVGDYSLLSNRLKTRRDLKKECSESCRAKKPIFGDYLPPCFWSINLFSDESLKITHDNPAAPDFEKIQDELGPYSFFTWPFKLAFVKDKTEQKKFGKYYPKATFERRIEIFDSQIKEEESIVFFYCNFDNPVSGEDMKYLVLGCARIQKKGEKKHFNPTKEQMEEVTSKRGNQNFPTLNWALQYSIQPNSIVRIPYHEYLEKVSSEEIFLDDIKVVIEEPELIEGFKYVAMDIDDDQTIFLLSKMKKSLMKVKEHGLIKDYDVKSQIDLINSFLEMTWRKRGYFPGYSPLLSVLLNGENSKIETLEKLLAEMIEAEIIGEIDNYANSLQRILKEKNGLNGQQKNIILHLEKKLQHYQLDMDSFLRLSTLNITKYQFSRILRKEGVESSINNLCRNPYLIFEEYTPGDLKNDPTWGIKIDGVIDLFKIDIALFPNPELLPPSSIIHLLKFSGPERIRAISIFALKQLENKGDCFETDKYIAKFVNGFSLFFNKENGGDLQINFARLPPNFKIHFEEKISIRKSSSETFYYLKEIRDIEKNLEQLVRSLLQKKQSDDGYLNLNNEIDSSCEILKNKLGVKFDEETFIKERRTLLENIFSQSIYVLNGSPGTGKSFELLRIIKGLKNKNEHFIVLTPTGKASLRLINNTEKVVEVSSKNVMTIDKFLSMNENCSVPVENLIIDEMSMVDLLKLAKLMKKVLWNDPIFKRLVLVGDQNQLPPIGYGKVFSDIIDYFLESGLTGKNYINLDCNCRQETSDNILEFAQLFSGINKSKKIQYNKFEKGDVDEYLSIKTWKNREELFSGLEEGIAKRDGSKSGSSGFLNISEDESNIEKYQILSPYRTSYSGANGINIFIQQDLKSAEGFKLSLGDSKRFKIGDKVIQLVNKYEGNELLLSNGALGYVIDAKNIKFKSLNATIHKNHINSEEVELAYCITVHKSQGSGFDSTFVILPRKKALLCREMVYTALTRSVRTLDVFIEESDKDSLKDFYSYIANRSFTQTRKTSLLKENLEFAYIPEGEIRVRSRIEYILYKKLQEAKEKFPGFDFEYEKKYDVKNEAFEIHPDFTLTFKNKTYYLEHLGMLNNSKYRKDWLERLQIFKRQNDFDKLITTDEIEGISDNQIDSLISAIVEEKFDFFDKTTPYSGLHASLRKKNYT